MILEKTFLSTTFIGIEIDYRQGDYGHHTDNVAKKIISYYALRVPALDLISNIRNG